MENTSRLSYFSQPDGLVDHAWRVGARTREAVQRSIDFEVQAYHERKRLEESLGGAALSSM